MADEPFDLRQSEFIRIIAEGGTWRTAARDLKVSMATFSKWLSEDAELEKQYTRALEAQGDDYAFKVIETAEDSAMDPNDKRVRIDAYKWAAGKRKPKVYGDRIGHEISGKGGDAIKSEVKFTADDETVARIASRLLGQ